MLVLFSLVSALISRPKWSLPPAFAHWYDIVITIGLLMPISELVPPYYNIRILCWNDGCAGMIQLYRQEGYRGYRGRLCPVDYPILGRGKLWRKVRKKRRQRENRRAQAHTNNWNFFLKTRNIYRAKPRVCDKQRPTCAHQDTQSLLCVRLRRAWRHNCLRLWK